MVEKGPRIPEPSTFDDRDSNDPICKKGLKEDEGGFQPCTTAVAYVLLYKARDRQAAALGWSASTANHCLHGARDLFYSGGERRSGRSSPPELGV